MKKFILILLVGLRFLFAPPIKASPKIVKQNIENCKFIQKTQPEILRFYFGTSNGGVGDTGRAKIKKSVE